MKLLFSIGVIVIVALIGSRLTFLNRRLPLGFKNILFTGAEYIFIGVILGRMGLNLIDTRSLNNLEPFLIFGLCWIGFLFGLQFEFRQLKNLPRFYFSISAIQAFITFLIVSFAVYLSFKALFSLPENTLLIMAITLGSAASCTAQSALAIVSNNYQFENRKLLALLRYISSVDGIFALGFFTIAIWIMPGINNTDFSLARSLRWFILSISLGIISALILIILSKTKFSQQEFLVFLIGTVLFCGGLASKANSSPLVIGFICGMVTANLCRHRLRALATIIHSEKSIYIILLIITGASWALKLDHILLITGIYVIIRTIGKVIGIFTATRIFRTEFYTPPALGLGLLSEGGLTIAIIINFKLLYPSLSDYLITIIILSMFVNELISPKFILYQIKGSKKKTKE